MAKEEKKKKKKEKTFEQELLKKEMPYNMVVATFLTFYAVYFSGMPQELGTRKLIYFLLVFVALVGILQIIIAPFSNRWAVGRASKLIAKEKEEGSTIESRTVLVKAIMKCPTRMMINVGCVFAFGVAILTFVLYNFFTKNLGVVRFYCAGGMFNSYLAALVGYHYSEKVCSARAIKIIKNGVDVETVRRDKFYGRNFMTRMVIFVVVVMFLTSAVNLLFFTLNTIRIDQGHDISGLSRAAYLKMMLLLFFNFLVSLYFARLLYGQTARSHKQINFVLEKLLANTEESAYLPTDLGNEFAYNFFLINEIIGYLHSIMADAEKTSFSILETTQTLSETAKETAETSLEESTSVKECLLAMGNAKDVLDKISNSIMNISASAIDTKESIDGGYELLHTDIIDTKMTEITNTNIETIMGIKLLSEKIDKVWEIINTIDMIAERTTIIAFNAELEATEASENGEVFHVIAIEIRRLATTISQSTQKIKEYIKSIQEFSDNLIVTSEVGTQKIREGSKSFGEIEDKFADMRTAVDITAESATSIQEITETQDMSFEQINATFEQISMGVDQFSQAAQYISDVSQELREIAVRLETINIRREETV